MADFCELPSRLAAVVVEAPGGLHYDEGDLVIHHLGGR